jgi:hypothetical protein
MTDPDGRAEMVCPLDGGRMQREELYRDQVDRRNGGAPRNPRIRYADRFDRCLLIRASG